MEEAKRVAAFIDGQNLYYAARAAFGYRVPNYDVAKLAGAVCRIRGWRLSSIRFYTGVPAFNADPKMSAFWRARFRAMRADGVIVVARKLRYEKRPVAGEPSPAGREKGIDVRIALDVMRAVYEEECDAALIFSQDQDFAEIVAEIRRFAAAKGRRIEAACAYPLGDSSANRRGINGADWIPIERAVYDSCVDARDYFPRAARAGR